MEFKTNPFWYIATKRFDSTTAEWREYVHWSGLSHLRELVTLDAILCKHVITTLSEEDWKHNVHEDYLVEFFVDADYLLKRIPYSPHIRFLSVQRNPDGNASPCVANRNVVFAGYDILDGYADVSLLTNCGEFPLAFDGRQLNAVGLFDELAMAGQVRDALTRNYLQETPHVEQCVIWAIWEICGMPEGVTK